MEVVLPTLWQFQEMRDLSRVFQLSFIQSHCPVSITSTVPLILLVYLSSPRAFTKRLICSLDIFSLYDSCSS